MPGHFGHRFLLAGEPAEPVFRFDDDLADDVHLADVNTDRVDVFLHEINCDLGELAHRVAAEADGKTQFLATANDVAEKPAHEPVVLRVLLVGSEDVVFAIDHHLPLQEVVRTDANPLDPALPRLDELPEEVRRDGGLDHEPEGNVQSLLDRAFDGAAKLFGRAHEGEHHDEVVEFPSDADERLGFHLVGDGIPFVAENATLAEHELLLRDLEPCRAQEPHHLVGLEIQLAEDIPTHERVLVVPWLEGLAVRLDAIVDGLDEHLAFTSSLEVAGMPLLLGHKELCALEADHVRVPASQLLSRCRERRDQTYLGGGLDAGHVSIELGQPFVPPGVPRDKLGDFSPIDLAMGSVNGVDLPRLHELEGVGCTDNHCDFELAAYDGGVRVGGAILRHDGGGHLHLVLHVWSSHLGEDDVAVFEDWIVVAFQDDSGDTHTDAGRSRQTFNDEKGRIHEGFVLLDKAEGLDGDVAGLHELPARSVVGGLDVAVATVMPFGSQADFRQGQDLVVRRLADVLQFGIDRLLDVALLVFRPNELRLLLPDLVFEDLQRILVEGDVVGVAALHEVFAKAVANGHRHAVGVAGHLVSREDNGRALGLNHQLDGNAHADSFELDALRPAVPDRATGEEARKAGLNGRDDVVLADDVQDGIVVARRGSIRQIFGLDARGPDRHLRGVAILGELAVGLLNVGGHVLRHVGSLDERAHLCGTLVALGFVPNIQPHVELNDLVPEARVDLKEPFPCFERRTDSGGHRDFSTTHFAEVRGFAANQVAVVLSEVLKGSHVNHLGGGIRFFGGISGCRMLLSHARSYLIVLMCGDGLAPVFHGLGLLVIYPHLGAVKSGGVSPPGFVGPMDLFSFPKSRHVS